ncbi:carboxypeptidase-like regulatory domain-containing protein [Telluribacter sp. SYSU D00476]|uniref:carboxypeptidase-like regulatory domain-containing protein n=1 Tax=Telluribacter sp. SYSU D00476 TaxID=2811430 RepID=UPI001FF561E0|nr:carboxypeptidase-like regulatory domain-containing protein [Telluribacter sp. SYSU D00476]
MKPVKGLVLALFFLGNILPATFVQVTLAQSNGQKAIRTGSQPLEVVLRQLQDRHGIYFNYNHQAIQNKQLSIDNQTVADTRLDQYLADLLHPLGLKVEKQQNRRYLIYEATSPTQTVPLPRKYTPATQREDQTATISGKVVDVLTGEPLPFASVYINSTTRGTTTREDGRYRLTSVPVGTIELVASYLGYETTREVVRTTGPTPRTVNIFLRPSANELRSVTVVGRRSRARQRQLRKFIDELLGQSPYASRCVLLNDSVVQFTEDRGKLLAKASAPLIIENRALGYRIHYDMTFFDTYRLNTHYAGTTRFEELIPENPDQAERWQRNRQAAYRGSSRHLLASMIAGTYEQEGFLVYQSNMTLTDASSTAPIVQFSGLRRSNPIVPDSLFRPGDLPFERVFRSSQPLEIFHSRIYTRNTPYTDMPYAYSILSLPQQQAVVTTDGWVSVPMGMEIRGYLGHDRLARLLPADWKPAGTVVAPLLAEAATTGTLLEKDQVLDSLTNQWRAYQQSAPPGVFLHIDKPFYTTGDTLWLSAYLLKQDGAQQNTVATVAAATVATAEPESQPALHVELLTAQGRTVAHQWLPTKEARSSGHFRLSDTLATGTYRLRAYTEADRGHPFPPFERLVQVHNWLKPPHPEISHRDVAPDVQFLPEGGHWVAGHPSRLGIKALDSRGRGIAVSGQVIDKLGKEIAEFNTNALGMGSVELTPVPDQTYRARVSGIEYKIPRADAEGLSLRADWLSDSSMLKVHILASERLHNQPVYIVLQNRGTLQQQAKLQLQQGKASIEVPTAQLPPGLTQVTLFDAQGRPRAERLVYVPERLSPVRVEILPNKNEYTAREQISLGLLVRDGTNEPLSAILSASVTDADQLPADTAADLHTHLLLSGELRGTIEQPRYYTQDNLPATRRALDDLLLTQGWRRLSWDQLPATPANGAPPTALVLRGRALTTRDRPIPDAKLLFTFTGSSQAFSSSVQANAEGTFTLERLAFTDTSRVRVVIMNKNLRVMNGRVLLDAPGATFTEVPLPLTDPADWALRQENYLTQARNRQEVSPELYREKDARLLQEVRIKGKKEDAESDARRISIHDTPDYSLNFDEKSRSYTNVYEMIMGQVPAVKVLKGQGESYSVIVRETGNFMQRIPPLFIVDGVIISSDAGDELSYLNPSDIERIEFLVNGGLAAYGARAAGGVIAIFTKKWRPGKAGKDGKSDFIVPGFPAKRQYYVPRYTDSTRDATRPDLRDVLYWNPLITTDSQGKSTISFPLSDQVRTLRVTIQGLTPYGQPISVDKLVKVR